MYLNIVSLTRHDNFYIQSAVLHVSTKEAKFENKTFLPNTLIARHIELIHSWI